MKKLTNWSAFAWILLLFVTQMAFAQKNNSVTISGKLVGFNNQVEVQDFSEFQYLLPPSSEKLIVPDADGNFTIKLNVQTPNYYRLGRNVLYLSPGDNLKVYIDYKDSKNATFEGKGAEANRYLRGTLYPKGGSFIEAGSQVKATIDETFSNIEHLATLRAAEIAKITGVSNEFKRLEAARIKADVINSYQTGQFYSVYKLKLKGTVAKEFEDNYSKAIAPIVAALSKNFADASLLKVEVYRDVADEIVKYGETGKDIAIIKDFLTASTLVRDMQKENEKSALQGYSTKIGQIKTINYNAAARKMAASLMAFGKGDVAKDFVVSNAQGDKIALSSLKGKVVYIDLWATWCGPCMQEMPEFEKLKERYKDNKEVVFVSLSIDDDQLAWKKSMKDRNVSGYQWIINRQKLLDYNIVGIPRVLLIDKNFKMASMSAPNPSSKNVDKEINALLK